MSVEVILLAVVTVVILGVWTLTSILQKRQDRELTGKVHEIHSSPKVVSEKVSDAYGAEDIAGDDTEAIDQSAFERNSPASMPAPASRSDRPMHVKKSMSFNAMPVRIVITGILLTAALFVILSNNYAPDSKNWAFGVVGTILGYWLKADKS